MDDIEFEIVTDFNDNKFIVTPNSVHSEGYDSFHHMNTIAKNDKSILHIFSGYNPMNFVVTKRDLHTGNLVSIAFPDGNVKVLNPTCACYTPTLNTKIYNLGFSFMVYNIRTLLRQYNVCNCAFHYLSYTYAERHKYRPIICAVLAGLQQQIRQWGNDVSIGHLYHPDKLKLSFRDFEVLEPHQTIIMSDDEDCTHIINTDVTVCLFHNLTIPAQATYMHDGISAVTTNNTAVSLWPNTLLLKSVIIYDRPYRMYQYDKYGRNTGV